MVLLVTRYYQEPHPRILFEDVPDEVYERMKSLSATPRRIVSSDDVHESEWDVLVTFAADASARSTSLSVLSFGGDVLDMHRAADSGYMAHLRRTHSTTAREIEIPSEVEGRAIRKLLEESVVSNVHPESVKWTWTFSTGGFGGHTYTTGDLDGACSPLMTIGPERFVLALWRRRDVAAEAGFCIALPAETTQHERWLAHLLEALNKVDSDRFPKEPDWQNGEEWASPAAATIIADIREVGQSWAAAESDFACRVSELQAALSTEQAIAQAGPLRLLTEKGGPLEEAVASVLSDLGFEVQEMDNTHVAQNGARLEDLRICTPEDGRWLCLAEVKGYASGVRENDVPQIVGKPATHLAITEKREPSSVWFIFNGWSTKPPEQRPPPFSNPDLALSTLEPFGGAAIDTRDLFRAWRDVVVGNAMDSDVRRSLLDARGLWAWTSPAPGSEGPE